MSNSGEVTVLPPSEEQIIANSLTDLVGALGGGQGFGLQTISQADTLYLNLRYYLISNNRMLLSQMYVEHGIVQTLIDQPVDDGFRSGFQIKTGHLDGEEIEDLEAFMEQHEVITQIMDAIRWARLFGGGAVMIITEQNPATPLKLDTLKEGQKFQFRAIDLWELYNNLGSTIQGDMRLDDGVEYFDYYGVKVHKSRIFPIKGKQAPSFLRPRLRGWGMSEVERLVRSINSYLKNQDVVFELLDEAKVDIFKMKGFNTALMTSNGTADVAKRVQHANMIKNYQNALTMDLGDEYEQKQINFAGLSEMLTQIRQGVAADVKMPMTKLFGISAAGFNSGEDDIENYNSMIEGSVRRPAKNIVTQAVQICAMIKFGVLLDDCKITWNPLRILSAKEEEEVKNSQFNRTMSTYQSGAMPIEEFKAAINKGDLLPIELDENIAALEPIDGQFTVGSETKVDA